MLLGILNLLHTYRLGQNAAFEFNTKHYTTKHYKMALTRTRSLHNSKVKAIFWFPIPNEPQIIAFYFIRLVGNYEKIKFSIEHCFVVIHLTEQDA